jgi:putative transposase
MTDSDGYDSIRTKIKTAYEDSHKRYGYRRICFELRNKGVLINHKTVRKLMLQLGLKAIRKKKHYNSYKGEVGRVASNEINRDFNADSPNQKWTTDVTQMEVCGTKIYLSPILDMFNGEIISYTISESPNMKMIKSMLDKAFRKHKELNGLIMHSDQGWQYQHDFYHHFLEEKGIQPSMSRKGNSPDNGMMESFFEILNSEIFYGYEKTL